MPLPISTRRKPQARLTNRGAIDADADVEQPDTEAPRFARAVELLSRALDRSEAADCSIGDDCSVGRVDGYRREDGSPARKGGSPALGPLRRLQTSGSPALLEPRTVESSGSPAPFAAIGPRRGRVTRAAERVTRVLERVTRPSRPRPAAKRAGDPPFSVLQSPQRAGHPPCSTRQRSKRAGHPPSWCRARLTKSGSPAPRAAAIRGYRDVATSCCRGIGHWRRPTARTPTS